MARIVVLVVKVLFVVQQICVFGNQINRKSID